MHTHYGRQCLSHNKVARKTTLYHRVAVEGGSREVDYMVSRFCYAYYGVCILLEYVVFIVVLLARVVAYVLEVLVPSSVKTISIQ